MIRRLFYRAIERFRMPHVDEDFPELVEAVEREIGRFEEERLTDLLERRKRLRAAKKRFRHLDGEIVTLRSRQLVSK